MKNLVYYIQYCKTNKIPVLTIYNMITYYSLGENRTNTQVLLFTELVSTCAAKIIKGFQCSSAKVSNHYLTEAASDNFPRGVPLAAYAAQTGYLNLLVSVFCGFPSTA